MSKPEKKQAEPKPFERHKDGSFTRHPIEHPDGVATVAARDCDEGAGDWCVAAVQAEEAGNYAFAGEATGVTVWWREWMGDGQRSIDHSIWVPEECLPALRRALETAEALCKRKEAAKGGGHG